MLIGPRHWCHRIWRHVPAWPRRWLTAGPGNSLAVRAVAGSGRHGPHDAAAGIAAAGAQVMVAVARCRAACIRAAVTASTAKVTAAPAAMKVICQPGMPPVTIVQACAGSGGCVFQPGRFGPGGSGRVAAAAASRTLVCLGKPAQERQMGWSHDPLPYRYRCPPGSHCCCCQPAVKRPAAHQ
jgi:hypothetical protein